MSKEKVGKIATELQQKTPDTRNPIELKDEMLKDFEENFYLCIEREKHKYDEPFFVVILAKREMVLTNVMRQYFFTRHTCPTPTFDQTVFRFDPKTYEAEYIWTIPDRDAAEYLLNNMLHLEPEEQELLRFVMDFRDGTLDKLCKKLNNEELNSEIIHIN